MPDTLDGKERIVRIETEIPHIEQEIADLRAALIAAQKKFDERLGTLETFMQSCSKYATLWGGACMAATAFGTGIYTFWNEIKAFITGLK
jgi:hypothetical protein